MKMAIPIRKKLLECNAIIENADTGISIITLYKQQFHEKIIDFINSSAFSALNKKFINLISKRIRNFPNNHTSIISTEHKWEFINKNSSLFPNLRGLIRIQRLNTTPEYKLARLIRNLCIKD